MNNPAPPTPLEVQYPNGGVLGCQMYVYDTASASPILWTGGIAFTGSVTVGSITGTKSNNAAAPGTTNFGVFPAICTTVSAGYTEGNLVALVVDTTGALKVAVTFPTSVTVSGTVAISNTTFNIGNTPNVLVVNTTGTAVPVTVQNTTVNAVITSIPAVNATVSNTAANPVAVTVQNTVTITGTVAVSTTTINATVTGTISNNPLVAFSNGAISSTTQRVVAAFNGIKYTNTALTSSTSAVSTVANVLNAYMIYNPNSSAAFVNLFDTTSVTLGTTAPAWVISIPATSAANLSQLGLAFSTALTINAATTFGGSTAPSTGLNVSLLGNVQ